MKKKVIIGIHGLGNKPSKKVLMNWWKKSMTEGIARIGETWELPKFDMIYWADVFNERPLKVRGALEDDPYYIHEAYTPAPESFVKDDTSTRKAVMGFLGRQLNDVFLNEDLSLNYPFISDLILSRYFRELSAYYHETRYDKNNVECMAKDLIRKKAVKTLKQYRDHDIFFIAHSMGSIVAFDVLTFMVADLPIHSFITMGSPLGLPVIISQIASEHKINGSREVIMQTPPGVKRVWYNFSDLNDNIAFNYMLEDDFRPNAYGVTARDFIVVNDYMIKDEKNPHKSFGYLRTREFAHALVDFITE